MLQDKSMALGMRSQQNVRYFSHTLGSQVRTSLNRDMNASTSNFTLDIEQVILRALKYGLEGLITAFAAYFIPGKKMDGIDVLMIGAVAAATFAVLDLFAPTVGASVRTGAGFGIGANLVGFPGGNAPNTAAFRG